MPQLPDPHTLLSPALPQAPASAQAAAARLPVLYVSHGSPMFALEAGQTGPALRSWGQQLRAAHPHVRAIVVMSPHWMAPGVEVMTHAAPPTWHDFGGFPEALYQLHYGAPGAPDVAQEVMALLAQAGLAARANASRPLDHGAWVPLMHTFPEADLPVVQLALPQTAGPAEVYALGQALASLSDAQILLVGSGSMTHNLGDFRAGAAGELDYVSPFSRWLEQRLQQGDTQALLDYRRQAPQAQRAHPSEEHFLPLFFAMGAAAQAHSAPHYLSREVMHGMLAMDAMVWPARGLTAVPAAGAH